MDLDKADIQGSQTERFTKLLVASQNRIYGFILALVPSRTDADDVLQEVIVVLWRKFAEFREGTDFAAWALGVARFAVLESRRRGGAQISLFEPETLDAIAAHAETMSGQFEARHEALLGCLQSLSDADRLLLRKRYDEEVSVKILADAGSLSQRAIYKSLDRIHEVLLACIRRRLRSEGL